MSQYIHISETQNKQVPASSKGEHKSENDSVNSSLFLPVQRKLVVGAVDDPLEDEADAMADRIMRMPAENFIQRKCSECKKREEEEHINRKPLSSFIQRKSDLGVSEASEIVSNKIESSKGQGASLDSKTKSFMEDRFGTNFSSVKIHNGNESAQMNNELNAKAFTVGNDIYFNEGEYQPHSKDGQHLLAHELTHVIQQKGNKSMITPQRIMRYPMSLEGDLNYTELSYTALEEEIKELQKYLNDKGINDEETDHLQDQLDLYRAELLRRKKLEDKPKKPKKRKQAKVQPRSLRECFAIDDSLPDTELYEEIDLIHLALQQGHSRKDRRRLKVALGALEAERMRRDGIRVEYERKATLTSALTKRIDEEADSGLLRIMKVIESMKPSESKPGMYSMISDGKVIFLTADEFIAIRAQVQAQLIAANSQIRNIAQTALSGYEFQQKVDDECWITSFWTKTLGGIDDPGDNLKDDVESVMIKTQLAKQLLKKGEFVNAATKIVTAAKLASEADVQYRTYVGQIQETAGNIVGGLTIIRNVSIALEAVLITGGAAAFIEGGGLATLGSAAGRGFLSLTLSTAPIEVAAVEAPAIVAAAETPALIAAAEAPTLVAAVEAPTLVAAAEAPTLVAAAEAPTLVAAAEAPTLVAAAEAPTALATVEAATVAETTSAVSTVTKAAAVASLTTLSGDSSPDSDEDDQKKQCKNPGEFYDPAAPTGFSDADRIPITWYKPLNKYENPIQIGGETYKMDEKKPLPYPYQNETIGIDMNHLPYEMKPLFLYKVPDRNVQGRFKTRLKSAGYNWRNSKGEALSPDHILDLMWNGPDEFGNLWPLESNYNERAGMVQNMEQIIKFRPDPKSPCAVMMPIGEARSIGWYNMSRRLFKINNIQSLW